MGLEGTLDTGSYFDLAENKLDFLYGETDEDRTLESQEGNPLNFISSVNHTTGPILLCGSQETLFLVISQEQVFHE